MISGELVKLVSQLVGFDTISPKSTTVPITEFIVDYLKTSGFEVQLSKYGNPQKCNIVATKGSNSLQPALAFAGHMDTVPIVRDHWKTDPFVLTKGKVEKEDAYFGLGVTDMKLFLAIMMMVSREVTKDELAKPFALYFTSDEEIGCIGAKKFAQSSGNLAESILIGEPTEMVPINRHKGYLYFKADFRIVQMDKDGQEKPVSNHSSDDRTSTNILTTVMPVALTKLEEFQHHLVKLQSGQFDPPYPTMNVGRVAMPDNAAKNIIPTSFVLEGDIRFLPGQDPIVLLEVLERYLGDAVSKIKLRTHKETVRVKVSQARKSTDSLFTEPTSLIAKTVVPIVGANLASVPFNTEGGIYNSEGAQTIICGPGSIKQAHKANEYALASWFDQSVIERYLQIIKMMCGGEK